MDTLYIRDVGHVLAKPASEFKVGEYRLYNYGKTGRIINITSKGKNSFVFTIDRDGQQQNVIVRATTLLALAPSFSDGTLCREFHKPASLQYNFEKNTCDRCGITKEEAKKHPVETGIDHPQYRLSTSFNLSLGGGVHCEKCHRESELEKLFTAMDARGM
jgi:hypothetical protein